MKITVEAAAQERTERERVLEISAGDQRRIKDSSQSALGKRFSLLPIPKITHPTILWMWSFYSWKTTPDFQSLF